MDALAKVDAKKRALPSKDGLPFYQLTPTTGGALKRFLDGLEADVVTLALAADIDVLAANGHRPVAAV